MFERMTDSARRSLTAAQDEARKLGHGYIGTEHMLLGLVQNEEGVAASGLRAIGIQPGEVRNAVLDEIGSDERIRHERSLPYTERAKKVLELSLREALQLGHSYINQGHILLALVAEGEGIATQVLQRLTGGFQEKRAVFIATIWSAALSRPLEQSEGGPSQKVREIGPIEIENGDVVIRTSNRFIEIASDQEHGDIQELYISMEKPDGTPTTLTIKFGYNFDGKQN